MTVNGPNLNNIHTLTGLENYQPDDSRETRLLGRFPMRNRFISDWIFEKTGKRRTAKQVGSRLQQLRDTCGGKRSKCSPFPHGQWTC
jgi:transcriptional enhancer factor